MTTDNIQQFIGILVQLIRLDTFLKPLEIVKKETLQIGMYLLKYQITSAYSYPTQTPRRLPLAKEANRIL